jgi:hypothetical protein
MMNTLLMMNTRCLLMNTSSAHQHAVPLMAGREGYLLYRVADSEQETSRYALMMSVT